MAFGEYTVYRSIVENPVYQKLIKKHSGFKPGKKDFKHALEDELVDIILEKGALKLLENCWVFGYCKCKYYPCYDNCIRAVEYFDTSDESAL